MKKHNKKTTSLSLALVLIAMVSSCASSDNESSAISGTTEAQTSEAVTTAVTTGIYDNIPEGSDFSGYEFNILRYGNTNWDIFLDPEEVLGEILSDAAFERNKEVEELLNITISEIREEKYEDKFKQAVKAGDGEAYDLVCFWSPGDFSGYITENLVFDWTQLPSVDLRAPWYNQNANDTFNIADKQYFAVSDLTFPVHQHFRILFNKDMVESLGLDMPYEAVHNGEWTFDLMMQYIKGIYSDVNGDGKADTGDRYGMVTNAAYSAVFPINSGEMHVISGDDGFEFNLYSDRIVSIVDAIKGFTNDPDIYYTSKTDNHQFEIFEAGNALFEPYGSDPQRLRSIENFDFGYLPYPKFDDSQEDYIVWSAGGLMAVPISLTDEERSGTVIEALSAASYKYVRDAFVEKYVEGKVLRDEDSVKIYRMMRDNAVYDLSYNVDPSGELAKYKYYSTFMNNTSINPSSYWESKKSQIVTSFEKLFELANNN